MVGKPELCAHPLLVVFTICMNLSRIISKFKEEIAKGNDNYGAMAKKPPQSKVFAKS
jgi:hypothetical protein